MDTQEKSNPLRGEVDVTGETGHVYRFRMGTNAIARMQTALNEKTIKGVLDRISKELKSGDFSVVLVRQLVQAASTQNITEDEAGDLVDDVGLSEALGAIAESLTKTIGGGAKNPRKGRTQKTN